LNVLAVFRAYRNPIPIEASRANPIGKTRVDLSVPVNIPKEKDQKVAGFCKTLDSAPEPLTRAECSTLYGS